MYSISNSEPIKPAPHAPFIPPTAEKKAAMRVWANTEAKRRRAESFEGRMETIAARTAPTPALEAAVLRRQLSIAKVASERADKDLAQAGTDAAQARARYESIQAELRGTLGNAA